tara:strand:- start:270 stop:989 length:720 start_codon:yes stop_codon:yes gene_type:complete
MKKPPKIIKQVGKYIVYKQDKSNRIRKVVKERFDRRFGHIFNDNPKTHLGGHFNIAHTDRGALKFLKEKLNAKSMIDIGCGPGNQVITAQKLGYTAIGIDGDKELLKNNYSVLDDMLIHDYTTGVIEFEDDDFFDVAWCVEFLEHVEEKYMKNYMNTFQRCKYVICTAAEPGEPGWHHVNCQTKQYWIEKFDEYGFDFSKNLTKQLRENSTMNIKLKKRKHFIKRRGWLFVNRSRDNEN